MDALSPFTFYHGYSIKPFPQQKATKSKRSPNFIYVQTDVGSTYSIRFHQQINELLLPGFILRFDVHVKGTAFKINNTLVKSFQCGICVYQIRKPEVEYPKA